MEKQSSFGNKLLFYILGTTLIVFGLTMTLVTMFSYENAQKDAHKFIKETSNKYSLEIERNINQSIIILKTFGSRFEEALNNNVKLNEQETIAYMKALLKQNKTVVGIFFKIKNRGTFFKEDLNSKGQNGYDKTGQFNPYVIRSNGQYKYQAGSPYNENDAWIKGPKETGKTFVTKPYLYTVDGVKVMMASISIPIYYNGSYIGIVGVDITLDAITKLTNSIKLFDNGYGFIVDNYGIVIAHPMKKIVNTKILESTNNDNDYVVMLDEANKGNTYSKMKKSFRYNLESLYFSRPIKIENSDQNWVLILSAPKDEYLKNAIFIRNFSIIAGVIGLILISIVIFLLIKRLNKNLSSISFGLDSFFKYLNKETNNSQKIDINSTDEFGTMAKNVNRNITKIQKAIDEDNTLIDDVKEIVNKVSQGLFNDRVNKSTSTESLNELKNLLNDMLDKLEALVGKDLNKISEVLDKYTQRDFTAKLEELNSGKIGKEITKMNEMVTSMLQSNQQDGISLQSSSNELTSSVSTLSSNATSQAASLEQTAASIDEITSNIQHTSEKAQEMLNISNDTKISANEGKTLATDTVKAMDEINETVININEAISVIDQIAFQTNILSLNAAVEAATAGEAGKGFAVVAGEVRNLASRSAEAANEIKALVESATQKANNGKNISGKMIEGFNQLEEKISTTNSLIDDVSNAAKEQTTGMTQIANAMGQLDQFTQENAAIAEKTDSIAKKTNSIAIDVAANVNKNNFIGKKTVSSSINTSKSFEKAQVEKTPSYKPENKTLSPKESNKVIVPQKQDNDEWESF